MAVLEDAGYSQTLSVLLTEPVATSVPSGFHAMHRRLLSGQPVCFVLVKGVLLTCAIPPPATSLDPNMADCEDFQNMTGTFLLTSSAEDAGLEPLRCPRDDDDDDDDDDG